MATIEIAVPDALVQPLLVALAWKYPEVDTSGLTVAQKGRRYIRQLLRDALIDHRASIALDAANAAYIQAQEDARAAAIVDVQGIG